MSRSERAARFRSSVGDETEQFFQATVLSVQGDGSVNLDYRGGKLNGVPCGSGYPIRTAGDQVVVLTMATGWLVISSVGCAATPPPEDIKLPPIPPKVTATWGTSAPAGAGWVDVTAATMYVRDAGSGARDFYFQTAAAEPAPSAEPTATPDDVTISPADADGYRSGHQDNSNDHAPAQGRFQYSSFGNWTGAWFYGTAIADACAGKTVDRMFVTLQREDSNHGWNRGVPAYLYLHTKTGLTFKTPALTDGPLRLGTLDRGEKTTFEIKDAGFISKLASGEARGLAVFADGYDAYLIYQKNCGQIKITFQ